MKLPQLLLRGFWFIVLIIGVFFVIDRMKKSEERHLLSRRSFVADTVSELYIYFASVPDTISFAGELFLVKDLQLREALEERYYYWTLSAAIFLPILQRQYRWKPRIEEALAGSQLPLDFFYLAVHLSELSLRKTGHQAGLWALDTARARNYGLEVNDQRDERLDILCSTEAVASELQNLYQKTQNWTKALALFCHKSTEAVADVLVLSQLLRHSHRFGYTIPPRHRATPIKYRIHRLVAGRSIEDLLKIHGVDSVTFNFYNPSLRDGDMQLPKGERIYLPMAIHGALLE